MASDNDKWRSIASTAPGLNMFEPLWGGSPEAEDMQRQFLAQANRIASATNNAVMERPEQFRAALGAFAPANAMLYDMTGNQIDMDQLARAVALSPQRFQDPRHINDNLDAKNKTATEAAPVNIGQDILKWMGAESTATGNPGQDFASYLGVTPTQRQALAGPPSPNGPTVVGHSGNAYSPFAPGGR